jgi:hypothetical protein
MCDTAIVLDGAVLDTRHREPSSRWQKRRLSWPVGDNNRSVNMSVKHELVTAEELWKVPEVSGKNVELIDGEVVEASPAAMRHGLIVGKVYVPIQDHVQRNALGSVAGDNVGFVLRRDPDEVRAPDMSFIAREIGPDAHLDSGDMLPGSSVLVGELFDVDPPR